MGDFKIGHAVSWSINYLQNQGDVNRSPIARAEGNGDISNLGANGTRVESGDMGTRSSQRSSLGFWEKQKMKFAKSKLSDLAKNNPQRLFDKLIRYLGTGTDSPHIDYNNLSPELKEIYNEALKNLAKSDPEKALTRISNEFGSGSLNKMDYNQLPSDLQSIIKTALSSLKEKDLGRANLSASALFGSENSLRTILNENIEVENSSSLSFGNVPENFGTMDSWNSDITALNNVCPEVGLGGGNTELAINLIQFMKAEDIANFLLTISTDNKFSSCDVYSVFFELALRCVNDEKNEYDIGKIDWVYQKLNSSIELLNELGFKDKIIERGREDLGECLNEALKNVGFELSRFNTSDKVAN